jgi:MoaA/NifB/PqqE/SkfB family radical SAM enzyme
MCSNHAPQRDFTLHPEKYKDMYEYVFEKTLPIVKDLKEIVIGGVGEPLLLRHGLIEKLRIIRSINPTVFINLFTNGLLLDTAEYIQDVFSLIDLVHISLNGTTTYNEIMLGGKYEKIKENLALIQKTRRHLHKKNRLALDFIVMRKNSRDIVSAVELAQTFGVEQVIYKNMWVFTEALEAESVLHDDAALAYALQEIGKAVAYGKKERISVITDDFMRKGN